MTTNGAAPNVNTPCARYEALEKLRRIPRDLMVGVERLKSTEIDPATGVSPAMKYLPRNPVERPVQVPGVGLIDPWLNRVERARLFNAFKEAVADLVGRAYAKPPEVDEATPQEMQDFLTDVDGRGTDLLVFGLGRCTTSVAEGIDFVLVDYPTAPAPGKRSAEDETVLDLRPVWRNYAPSAVIDWTFGSRGGQQVLLRTRLREERSESRGDWGSVKIPCVRVLYAGDPSLPPPDPDNPTERADGRFARYEVWEPVKADELGGAWTPVRGGSMAPQIDIPLVGFATDVIEPFDAEPPLLDLAHLTVAHYRKSSDLDNAQHAVGFPFLHWAGGELDEDGNPVGIGPDRLLVSKDPNAKLEFVEPAGTSWAAVQASITNIESAMAALSSEPVTQSTPGNLTATGEAIRAARSHSKLEAWVLGWQDSFARLLYFTAIYLGKITPDAEKGWGGLTLNRKFVPTSRQDAVLKHREYLHTQKVISSQTIHESARGDEVIPPEIEWEEEQERVTAEGAASPFGMGGEGGGVDLDAMIAAAKAKMAAEAGEGDEGDEGGGEPPTPFPPSEDASAS